MCLLNFPPYIYLAYSSLSYKQVRMIRKAIHVTARLCIYPWRLVRSLFRSDRNSSHAEPATSSGMQSSARQAQKRADTSPSTEIGLDSNSQQNESHPSQLSNTPVHPCEELDELRQLGQRMDIVEFVNSRERYLHDISSMVDLAYADVRMELAIEAVKIMDTYDTSSLVQGDAVIITGGAGGVDGTVVDTNVNNKTDQEIAQEVSMNPIVTAQDPAADDKQNIQPARNFVARLFSIFY
ncbi:hypothetical protein V1509DRAFT_19377 [Lipomyces kononenkoae]